MTLKDIRDRQEEIATAISGCETDTSEWLTGHKEWLTLQRQANALEAVRHAEGEHNKHPLRK